MILSYLSAPFSPHDPLDPQREDSRCIAIANISTQHSASGYGQPVVVMPRGEAIDATTWIVCEFRIVRASPEEREILARMGLV